jgi:excisionase family DNA binding protein
MPVAEKTRLVPLPEAADRLGVTVSTIRAWIYRRSVPYTKVGRAVRLLQTFVALSSSNSAFPFTSQTGLLSRCRVRRELNQCSLRAHRSWRERGIKRRVQPHRDLALRSDGRRQEETLLATHR